MELRKRIAKENAGYDSGARGAEAPAEGYGINNVYMDGGWEGAQGVAAKQVEGGLGYEVGGWFKWYSWGRRG